MQLFFLRNSDCSGWLPCFSLKLKITLNTNLSLVVKATYPSLPLSLPPSLPSSLRSLVLYLHPLDLSISPSLFLSLPPLPLFLSLPPYLPASLLPPLPPSFPPFSLPPSLSLPLSLLSSLPLHPSLPPSLSIRLWVSWLHRLQQLTQQTRPV